MRMGSPSGWGGVITLTRVTREDFTDKVYLERPKRGEGEHKVKITTKILGQGHACDLRNGKNPGEAGAE